MDNRQFRIRLLKWYQLNKRDLPFRNTKNPYAIWLSEIILQQTRVAQGLDYYLRFLDAYPDIFAFAAATEDEIMKLWQGLGYYSRARYMLTTAREIVEKHNGSFPSHYNELIKLKGIGEYTAAAIASISFNEAIPAVDGNVLRVFARFAGIEDTIDKGSVRKSIRESLKKLIDKDNPAEFNQAMIELGALICTPRSPDCVHCPLNIDCYALMHELQTVLPRKKPKTTGRTRYFHYLIINSQHKYLLSRRGGNDIWRALYEFPLIETKKDISPEKLLEMEEFTKITGKRKVEILKISGPIKHQLSHQTIQAYFYHIRLNYSYNVKEGDYLSISRESLAEYAFPRLIEKYLEDMDYLE